MPGIIRIETKLERDLFVIRYDAAQIKPDEILDEIAALGFTARAITEQEATVPLAEEEGDDTSPVIAALLERAQRENKPLVLEFSGKFCGACRELEKKVLHNPKVEAELKKVIFHQVMVEKDRAAARQYGIRAIPQLRFLAPDGTVVSDDQGVISVETMLGHLKGLEKKN